jgi:N-methylhydantoinase B
MEFYGEDATFSTLSERAKSEPWGLFGGSSARPARYVIDPESEDATTVSSKSTTDLEPGDVASVQTPGGGGYGDPTERDPRKVLEDVVNGKVSVEAAREVYGVVIDQAAREVDEAATRERRTELAESAESEEGESAGTAGNESVGVRRGEQR